MALDTAKPTMLQPPAPAVVVAQPGALVREPPKDVSPPPTNATNNGSSLQDDFTIAQNAVEGMVLAGRKGNFQPHKHHPIAKLKKIFGFSDKSSEQIEAAEIVMDPATRNVPAQTNGRDYSSIRPPIDFGAQQPVGDWQKIINAHVRHDATGHAIDDGGKRIDISHMNTEFGQKLAQICETLDAHGYAGKYEIISGVRSKEEQQMLYAAYKKAGSNHPVALPGNSLHELGCAVDIKCIGGDSASFFSSYHGAALHAGLALVANDKEHVQLPRSEVHNFIMQQGPQFKNIPYEVPRHHQPPAMHTV